MNKEVSFIISIFLTLIYCQFDQWIKYISLFYEILIEKNNILFLYMENVLFKKKI
jgi:hypothetical protein